MSGALPICWKTSTCAPRARHDQGGVQNDLVTGSNWWLFAS